MPQYKRLISYVYSYNNGVKSKNVGFGKVEKMDNRIKYLINLKGAYTEERQFDIYFYTRKDQKIYGKRAGQMLIELGQGECRGEVSEESLGCEFDEVGGIYILGNNLGKMFASQWEDICFEPLDISDNQGNSDIQDKSANQVILASNDISAKQDIPLEYYEAINPEITPVWERPIIKEMYLSANEIDEKTNPEIKSEIVSEIKPELKTNSIPKYEKLFDLVRFDIFCDDDIYSCADIGLEDLKILPEEIAVLSGNSFLCHGFYNYKHLLLARKDDESLEHGLVLGVPGVYGRCERISASMYGFDRFKFSMRPEIKESHFGYWYRLF